MSNCPSIIEIESDDCIGKVVEVESDDCLGKVVEVTVEGLQGADGKSIEFKGDYSASTSYGKSNLVRLNGVITKFYISLEDENIGHELTDTDWWKFMFDSSSGGVSVAWGTIFGTLSNQTDLQSALNAKANVSSLATVATTGAYSDLSGKPSIPSSTSQLTNDSGFITSSALSPYRTASAQDVIDSSKQPVLTAGTGIAITNDVISSTVNPAVWGGITGTLSNQTDLQTALGLKANSADLATVATSGAYSDLSGTPSIPTKTSQLTNDSGFLTEHQSLSAYRTASAQDVIDATKQGVLTAGTGIDITNNVISATGVETSWGQITGTLSSQTDLQSALDAKASSESLATVATSGSYSDLSNKPTIPVVPTNVSAFTNDSGYITKSVNDLTNYTRTNDLATVATTGTFDSLAEKPTTLSGYGITDAKIVGGVITLGSNTITPITSHQSLSGYATESWVEAKGYLDSSSTLDATKLSGTASINTTGNATTATTATDYSVSGGIATALGLKANSADLASVATLGTFASLTSKPTTLSGYGITDANITGGVITIGSDSITPLTQHQSLSAYRTSSAQDSIDSTKANLSGASFTGGVKETSVSMTTGEIDLSQGNCFTKIVSSATTLSITNAGSCSCFSLILTNGGSQTITYPSSVRWDSGTPPTLTSSGTDVISFITPDSGTTWYGILGALDAKAST